LVYADLLPPVFKVANKVREVDEVGAEALQLLRSAYARNTDACLDMLQTEGYIS
jgi:hypothetical protein